MYAEVSLLIEEAKRHGRTLAAMPPDWLNVIEWNKLHFDGLQHYYLAIVHQAAHEHGAALSRLTFATDQCARAVNACRGALAAEQLSPSPSPNSSPKPNRRPRRCNADHARAVRARARECVLRAAASEARQ